MKAHAYGFSPSQTGVCICALVCVYMCEYVTIRVCVRAHVCARTRLYACMHTRITSCTQVYWLLAQILLVFFGAFAGQVLIYPLSPPNILAEYKNLSPALLLHPIL